MTIGYNQTMCCMTKELDFDSRAGTRYSYFLNSVQTRGEIYPASYPLGINQGFPSRVKWPGHGPEQSPQYSLL